MDGCAYYKITLTGYSGEQRMMLIAGIKEIFDLSLREAKEISSNLPSLLLGGLTAEEGASLARQVRSVGGEVEISEDHAATAHNDDLAELSCPYCGTVTVWVAGSWRCLVQKLREDGVPLPHGFGKAELDCYACGKRFCTMPHLTRGRK